MDMETLYSGEIRRECEFQRKRANGSVTSAGRARARAG